MLLWRDAVFETARADKGRWDAPGGLTQEYSRWCLLALRAEFQCSTTIGYPIGEETKKGVAEAALDRQVQECIDSNVSLECSWVGVGVVVMVRPACLRGIAAVARMVRGIVSSTLTVP